MTTFSPSQNSTKKHYFYGNIKNTLMTGLFEGEKAPNAQKYPTFSFNGVT